MLAIPVRPAPFRYFHTASFIRGRECLEKNPSFRLVNLPVASFYLDNLGIICRAEWKLDKISPVPFRFRLGSLDYVNWLERKPNAVKPQ